MIHICLFKAKFGDTGYVSPLEKHKNKPELIEATSRNRQFDWGWEWRVMTHECTEEPPSSFFRIQSLLWPAVTHCDILTNLFCYDIIFDCMDRRSLDLMTSIKVSVHCIFRSNKGHVYHILYASIAAYIYTIFRFYFLWRRCFECNMPQTKAHHLNNEEWANHTQKCVPT